MVGKVITQEKKYAICTMSGACAFFYFNSS